MVLLAQTPCFTVENNITLGCTPLKIKVKNCAIAKWDVLYRFDNALLTFDSVHTFNKSGVYTVLQYVRKDSADPKNGNYFISAKQTITVIDAKPPLVNFVACTNSQLRIDVNDTVNQKYAAYYIDYGDGSKDTIDKWGFVEHQFADSLTKNITIQGVILPANCGVTTTFTYDQLFVSLRLPTVKSFKTTSISKTEGEIALDFVTRKYLMYELVLNGKPYDTLTQLEGDQTYFFKHLNTVDEIYNIQINVLDVCHGTSLKSDTYHVLPFQVSLAENQNIIAAMTYPEGAAIKGYELYRNNVLFKTFNQKDFPAYIDSEVKCAVQYCYTLKSILNDGVYMMSANSCVKTISTIAPPAPQGLNSTIVNELVQLTCQFPQTHTVKKFTIYQSENAGPFQFVSDVKALPILSGKVNFSNKLCYKITVSDSCDNVSPLSFETCPVFLTATDITETSIKLFWNNYVGWDKHGTKSFTLQWINDQEKVYRSLPLDLRQSFEDLTEDTLTSLIRYRIMAEGLNDDFVSFSNIMERKQAIKLYFPTAFTPNNDGLNDVYLPKGRYVAGFKMYVYNRLGQLIFFTDDFFKGWQGEEAMAGDYVIQVEANDTLGNVISKKLVVTLIR